MNKQSGFTLIEIMTAVAIVGIGMAIAIPSYLKMLARERQNEAKIALAGIYAAEATFSAENGTFSSCIYQLGYLPKSQPRYYYTGFQAATGGAVCGPSSNHNGYPCNTYNYNPPSPPPATLTCTCNAATGETGLDPNSSDCTYVDTATGGPALIALGGAGTGTWVVEWNSFTAGATGYITNSGNLDTWTIDQTKTLNQTQSGI